MVQIAWNKLTPPEMRALIEPILDRYKWLLPKWMTTLYVGYWDNDPSNQDSHSSTHCSITINDDYLNGSLNVYSDWMDGDDEMRRSDIVHEFLHAYFNPLGDFCSRVLNTWKEEDRGPMWKLMEQERISYFERSVANLAWTLIQQEKAEPALPKIHIGAFDNLQDP